MPVGRGGRGRSRSSRSEKEPRRGRKKRTVRKTRVHKVDMDKVKAQMRRIKSRQSQFWKPKVGKNLIRILPPWSDEAGTWFKEVLTHYLSQKRANCPALSGGRCALCDFRAKLRRSPSPIKQKQADHYKPTLSHYVNMVDVKDPDSGVQIGRLSDRTVTELLEYFVDSEYGDFTHPVEGYDVLLTREGEGIGTRYTIRLRKNPSKIKRRAWLEELHDLDDKFPAASFGETKAMLEEGDDDADEEEYDEEDEGEEEEEEEEEWDD